ncbi:HAD family hydrolase, partial [bacterium]
MLRAILFDFNGVLVDDEPIHLELFQRVLAEEGISFSAEDYYASYLGLDDRAVFAAVLQAAGEVATIPRLLRLIARKASYYQESIRERGYPFFPGAVELVEEAASAGRMLGVVSGALREEVEGALRQARIRELFKVLVTTEDTAGGKPDPEGYRRALEALNALPPLP